MEKLGGVFRPHSVTPDIIQLDTLSFVKGNPFFTYLLALVYPGYYYPWYFHLKEFFYGITISMSSRARGSNSLTGCNNSSRARDPSQQRPFFFKVSKGRGKKCKKKCNELWGEEGRREEERGMRGRGGGEQGRGGGHLPFQRSSFCGPPRLLSGRVWRR